MTSIAHKTGKLVGGVTVHFAKDALDNEASQGLVAHEGSHVYDDKTVGRRNKFDFEFDAHETQSPFLEAQGISHDKAHPQPQLAPV
jgi:hypothetical protein